MHKNVIGSNDTQISIDPGNMGPLGEWLPEAIWPKLKSLERIKRFHNIGDAMQSDSDDWQVSFTEDFPGQANCVPFIGFPPLVSALALGDPTLHG